MGKPNLPDNEITRFSVSLPGKLLCDLDQMVDEKGYDSRSEAIADMIRARLVEHHWTHSDHEEIAGTITLVFDHHHRGLQAELTDLQHDAGAHIVSTLHVHLDHDHCLEVIVTRGPAGPIKRLADRLIATHGVTHGALTVITTGKDLITTGKDLHS